MSGSADWLARYAEDEGAGSGPDVTVEITDRAIRVTIGNVVFSGRTEDLRTSDREVFAVGVITALGSTVRFLPSSLRLY